jgi:ribosomal-protein-alanine N-acetyltransferase
MTGLRLGTINQVDDLEPVLAIEQRSFQWPWGRLSFEGELACGNSRNYIVKSSIDGVGEQVAAYAFFRLVADEIHLLKIAVTPAWRRKGIATHLLQHCFAISAVQGANSVHLEVRSSNLPAIELYLKLGFEVIGKRHRYYADTKEDALLMMKTLKEEL